MAQTNMTVQVQCIFPSKAQCTILSVPTNATFRDIRKQVENLFNGDGCVLVFNGIIANIQSYQRLRYFVRHKVQFIET